METNNTKPLLTCRKRKPTSKPGGRSGPGKAQGKPTYHLGGVRHKGGVNMFRALVRKAGTCRLDEKGETQMEIP